MVANHKRKNSTTRDAMPLTKVLIYTRFSPRRADQMENCVSPQVQEDACRAFAKQKGYRVVGVFNDEGVSRDSLARPGLAQCVGCTRKGMVVLVYSPDRLGSTIPAAVASGEIERKGARVEYTNDAINGDGPIPKLMRGIMHAMAEFDRAMTGEKTSMGMLRRQGNGQRMTASSRVPFGKAVDPEDDKMLIDCEDEIKVIEQVLELYEDGMGYKAIADKFDADGVPTRTGKPWQFSTIRNIVKRHS